MNKTIFVTGTDTGVGKTYVTAGLLQTARTRKLQTIAVKPVASGGNDDTVQLQQAATISLEDNIMTPFMFAPPVAPHLAAAKQQMELSSELLIQRTRTALDISADLHIIEGFGGWHAPLNARETMADYAVNINSEILLVVGMRLGCLNHALLTERAIAASGGKCIGWIANIIDPDMLYLQENIAALKELLQSPLHAVIQHQELAADALQHHSIF